MNWKLTLIAACAFGLHMSAQPARKKILAIGEVKGYQHDSVSHALSTLEQIGHQTGLWDTYIRTDCELVTKQKLAAGNAKNLNYFDAVVFYTTGELDMNDQQKADLLSFIKDDGKGFVGIHSATDTFYKWPEYGDMIGGWFDEHPWGTFFAPVVVEDPNFPGMKAFPKEFTIEDEIYQIKNFSRDKVRVLMTLDANKLDMKNPRVHRTDRDFAVAWARNYGKGRVYYNTLGHRPETWDRPDFRECITQGIKWALGMVNADATPRPKP